MRKEHRYLDNRGGHWRYVRRVPSRLAHLDPRGTIRVSLKTDSLQRAMQRRDAMEAADDALWAALDAGDQPASQSDIEAYERVKKAALTLGFPYKTLDELSAGPMSDLVARLDALSDRVTISAPGSTPVVEALLGGADEPKTTISQVLESYLEIQGPIETKGKSPHQAKSWAKVKRRAVADFKAEIGDLPMVDITRKNAVAFTDWWARRVTGAAGGQKLSGNTANRSIGNIRLLYRWHFDRLGDDRQNPFEGRSLPNPKSERKQVLPFSVEWITQKILVPEAWVGCNVEAALAFLALVETGCRPSEVANLPSAKIDLSHEVPHITVEPREDRAIKTEDSARVIPLVGVSLAAMRAAPQGFPRYHDKEDTLSATLMKHFRRRDLFPTSNHRIYSIRHAFDDRTLEGGFDRDLRARMMGHTVKRPDYGQGGSLAFRRDELLKIALPFPADLIPSILSRR